MQNHFERIGYAGSLEELARGVCAAYDLGRFKSCSLVEVGYEDFNFSLVTNEGGCFVKVFADFRTLEECRRYLEVVDRAGAAGVATPRLIKRPRDGLGLLQVGAKLLRFCVLELVDGDNLLALQYRPGPGELEFLGGQAALIASIELKPPWTYDSWAVVNFPKEFGEKGGFLQEEERALLQSLVDEFTGLEIEKLPHCFVHGDLIATNVLRDRAGQLWIVDFAVSNYYPRIQELAVLGCNLCFDSLSREKSAANVQLVLNEYQLRSPLTSREAAVLPRYVEFAHAMHVLRANYEKVANGNSSAENEYWLNQGRLGLKQGGLQSQ